MEYWLWLQMKFDFLQKRNLAQFTSNCFRNILNCKMTVMTAIKYIVQCSYFSIKNKTFREKWLHNLVIQKNSMNLPFVLNFIHFFFVCVFKSKSCRFVQPFVYSLTHEHGKCVKCAFLMGVLLKFVLINQRLGMYYGNMFCCLDER